MFKEFSINLYNLVVNEEYRIVDRNGFSSTDIKPHWLMQKAEMATFINFNVIDLNKIKWQAILENSNANENSAINLMESFKYVANIYVLFGEKTPEWTEAEEYFGQEIYSVFWFVNSTTGKITAPKGQPKKLFGLNQHIENAFKQISNNADIDISNFGKRLNPLKQKNNYPVLTISLITINLIVLLLIYLNGFPTNIFAPRTFGAIYPPWVFEYGQWWRLFTAMFVHFGWQHFLSNTLGLLIFGLKVEKYFGHIMFLLIYVLSGLVGSLFSIFITTSYSAGASGAIYGIVGFLFVFTRLTKRSVEFLNWYLMFSYIAIGIAMGFAMPGIDNAGHIGGLITGGLIGFLVAKGYPKCIY